MRVTLGIWAWDVDTDDRWHVYVLGPNDTQPRPLIHSSRQAEARATYDVCTGNRAYVGVWLYDAEAGRVAAAYPGLASSARTAMDN
jgi:hypothetical protein